MPRMDDATFAHQVDLAAFAPGVRVEREVRPEGQVLRVHSAGGVLELLVTREAARMYGEGPALNAALASLRRRAEVGLPAPRPDGRPERLVFVGD